MTYYTVSLFSEQKLIQNAEAVCKKVLPYSFYMSK